MKRNYFKRFINQHQTLILVLFAQLFTLTMTAEEVIIDGIKYDVVKKAKQATVIANSYSGNVVIPSSFTFNNVEYSVTSIGEDAFSGCSRLTSVTIPNSVTSIGYGAFSSCSVLTSVTIPNSVTSIGGSAFWYCRGLTSVTIPNSVTSIGNYAFYHCSGLTSVTIGNSVTSIGKYAFSGCSGLTSVTIPNSVTSIESDAFSYCIALTSVHITDLAAWFNITFGGSSSNPLNYAHHLFLNGQELKNLEIPNSVTSIGGYAFSGCSGLTSVTILSSVTNVGNAAFSACSGLTSIDIPNSVTSIGNYAFSDCSGLTSVTIGNSVTSIGGKAFANCEELMDVYCLAKKAPTTTAAAFEGSFPEYITLHVMSSAIEDYKATAPWSDFGTIIAISGDDSSPKIQFADATVKAICLEDWDINGDGELSEAEAAEVRDKHIGTKFKDNVEITSFNELQYFTGLTSIGNNTFYGCSSLTSVTIPNSVTSIGNQAFYNCSGLTSVTIPSSVTSIGYEAFRACSGLTSVTIPNSVTSIGSSAFYGCSGLTSVTIGNSVTSIGQSAFSGCSRLTSVTIPNSVTSIGYGAFSSCSVLTSLKVEEGNPKYDSRNNCNAIIESSTNTLIAGCKTTTIPNSVTSIRGYAFSGCSGLTSITIPNSVTSIGDWAFRNCSSLTSVTIPNSVTSIGEYAFCGCSGLTSVTCHAMNVPTTENTCFYGVLLSTRTLYVPASAVNAYKSTSPWSGFGTILPVAEPTYIVGDANGNGEVEIGDVTSVLTLMATPDASGYNNKAADANGNGEIEIGDVTTILTIMAGN